MSWSITQFNFGTTPYFTHAPGIAIRCESTGSLPHCAGVANDCYCWSCFLNSDEIPTAIEHHKNLQDVRDVCVRVRSLLSEVCGMHSGFWVLLFLYIDLLHRQPSGAGKCLSQASASAASAGATGLWI